MSLHKSKMYILIKDDPKIDMGHLLLAAAHASLSGYLTFLKHEHSTRKLCHGESPYEIPTVVEKWVEESFRKVVCKVSPDEFETCKSYGVNMKDYRIMVECGLDNMEVAIVVCPRDTNEDNSFNHFLKSLKLYK